MPTKHARPQFCTLFSGRWCSEWDNGTLSCSSSDAGQPSVTLTHPCSDVGKPSVTLAHLCSDAVRRCVTLTDHCRTSEQGRVTLTDHRPASRMASVTLTEGCSEAEQGHVSVTDHLLASRSCQGTLTQRIGASISGKRIPPKAPRHPSPAKSEMASRWLTGFLIHVRHDPFACLTLATTVPMSEAGLPTGFLFRSKTRMLGMA